MPALWGADTNQGREHDLIWLPLAKECPVPLALSLILEAEAPDVP